MAICEICNDGKEYKNLGVHKKLRHDQSSPTSVSSDNVIPPVTAKETGNVEQMFGSILNVLGKMQDRISNLEIKGGGRDDSFKKGRLVEDVVKVEGSRSGVDERIVKIVDEVLGEDFGIEVVPRDGQPGLNFTILVPQRLSEIPISTRPVRNPESRNGEYLMNPDTKQVVTEEYWPGDRRTRAISSVQSYEAIRDYCEKVRSYIVTYYQKLSRPIPEFKLKSYV